MTDLNKVISLFIGLFVVILVVSFLLGRITIAGRKAPSMGGALGRVFGLNEPSATPAGQSPLGGATPVSKPTAKNIVVKKTVESDGEGKTKTVGSVAGQKTSQNNTQTVTKGGQPVGEIPRTGAGLILPLSALLFGSGTYLLKKAKA